MSCADDVAKHLGIEGKDALEELNALDLEVKAEMSKYKAADISVNRGMKEFLMTKKEVFEIKKLQQRRDAAYASLAEIEMMRDVSKFGKGKEQAKGVLSVILGDTLLNEHSAYNIGKGKQTRWQNDLVHGIESLSDAHLKTFISDTDSAMTARAMYLLRKAKNELTPDESKLLAEVPQINKDIADVINKTSNMRRVELNEASARIGEYEGFAYSGTHNAAKIKKAGFDAWWANTKEKLDYKRIFGEIDTRLDADMVHAQAKQWYKGLSTGTHKIEDGFGGAPNIASELSQHRTIHFLDGDTFHAYQTEFGAGSLKDSIVTQIHSEGKKYGIMRKLGPKWKTSIDRVIANTKKLADAANDEDALIALNSGTFKKELANDIGFLDGSIDMPANQWVKTATDAALFVQTTSKLGSTLFSSITDVPNMMMASKVNGRTVFSGMADAIDGIFNTRSSKADKQAMARALNINLDVTRMSFAEAISGNGQLDVGLKAKAYATFFKLNMVSWWTNAMKRGNLAGNSAWMAHMADQGFDKLDIKLQRGLEAAGIDADTWKLTKYMVADVGEGKMLSPDQTDLIPEADIKAYLESKGQTVTPNSLRSMRKKVGETLSTFYNVASESAIIEPSGKTQSAMRMGLQDGTFAGSANKLFTQFKSFPVAQYRQRLVQDAQRRTGERFGTKAFGKGQAGAWMPNFAQHFVFMGMMGYAANSLRGLSQGKGPMDPLSLKTAAASVAQGGAMGIYGDFLFGDMKSRYGAGPLQTFLGPTYSAIDSAVGAFGKAKEGEDPTSAIIRLIHQNTPGQNLLFTRGAMNYFIMDRVYNNMSPGRAARTKKRVEEQEDRTLLWQQTKGF